MKAAIYLLIVIAFLNPKIVLAQQTPALSPDKNVWMALTIGPALSGFEPGITARATAEYASTTSIYALEYMAYSNLNFIPSNNFREFSAIGVMYGHIKRYDFFKLTYSAGLSLVIPGGDTGGRYTFGLPLSAQFILTPLRLVAAGVRAYACYIPGNSVVGIGLAFYLGKVH
ncbi:MAG: hypothetical protein D6677_04935 [Calditrichaeota bacterium]|nr:MAG: hypothetical protein D6677_04935 [Calditrichota bacterium]